MKPYIKILVCCLQMPWRACWRNLARILALMAATFLTLAATAASAQFGVLDESREILRGSGLPQSTDPGESFTIDSGSGVAEEGDTELEKLLRVSETTIFSDVTTATGRVLSLRSKSLGSFDRSELLAGTQKVRAMLYDYFATHESVTRDAKSYEFKVSQVQGNELTNVRVIFQQIVNGLPVEPKSNIDVSVAGNVIALVLYVVNPAHPYFDSSVWLDKPQLIALARAAWGNRCASPLPAGPGTEEFLITLNQESWEFNPVFQLSFGSLVIQVHAVTGVTVIAQNLNIHAVECR